MATAIDTQVLSKTNQYAEINRDMVASNRAFSIAPHAFKPILRQSLLDKETEAMRFNSVVGRGETTWFSPSAVNSCLPFADIVARRHCADNLQRLEFAWLCKLVTPRTLLRERGTTEWFGVAGDIAGMVLKGWPMAGKDDMFVPKVQDNTSSKTFTITDLDKWESMPVEPVGPLRQACLHESKKGELSRREDCQR